MKYLLLLILVLGSCSPDPEQAEDLRMQQEVIRNIIAENQELREVNNLLRKQVVSLSENVSRSHTVLQLCAERYPGLLNSSQDLPSPAVRVPISDILVQQGSAVINVPDLQQGIVAASKSMDPLLDEHTVVLEVRPKSPAEVHVGDIIIYEHGADRIVHRVIRIDHDRQGWYAVTKGDNNIKPDPEVVRFESIRGVVIAVIY